MDLIGEINFFAVLVGAVVNIGVGMLWYSPILFGNVWLRLRGKTADKISGAGPAMALAAQVAVISSFVLSLVVHAVGATIVVSGLVAGVAAWIGIGATATFVTSVYEDRPYSVWLLNACYQLVVYAIQRTTFAVWG